MNKLKSGFGLLVVLVFIACEQSPVEPGQMGSNSISQLSKDPRNLGEFASVLKSGIYYYTPADSDSAISASGGELLKEGYRIESTLGNDYEFSIVDLVEVEFESQDDVEISSPLYTEYYKGGQWIEVNSDTTISTSGIRTDKFGSCTLATEIDVEDIIDNGGYGS